MQIRPFILTDTDAVIALWHECGLTRPWNDPLKDIERKLTVQPELFLVGIEGDLAAGGDGSRTSDGGSSSGSGSSASRAGISGSNGRLGGSGTGSGSTGSGIGTVGGSDTIVGTAMVGFDGHRGWINYLAVSPAWQRRGYARQLMTEAEALLTARGCPKLNLQVRSGNSAAEAFYRALGYVDDHTVSFGKRLIPD
ncbi:GNAT family N-acetyltransferase [Subtercola endophyticus]|uniref:GNAT family N-acetyltransferase n=1 Tax=Subtercola endophyticus TaxID=2895559 RepID=UPI001E295716|nr:GNAT family N-acetyltransferase [Subtercola endophyticus]UFS57904.1 GNAT family N-acetyltransferase [Subtercola endophyticus]